MRKAMHIFCAAAALAVFSAIAGCAQTGAPTAISQVPPEKMNGIWTGNWFEGQWSGEAELGLVARGEGATGRMTTKSTGSGIKSYRLHGKASGERLMLEAPSRPIELVLSRADDGTLFLNGSYKTMSATGSFAFKRKQ
jgi:hypothetical protein